MYSRSPSEQMKMWSQQSRQISLQSAPRAVSSALRSSSGLRARSGQRLAQSGALDTARGAGSSNLLLFVLCLISLCLLADDVDQVSNRHLHIDQVQSPIRLYLPVRHDIAGDLIGARIGGIAMNFQRKV